MQIEPIEINNDPSQKRDSTSSEEEVNLSDESIGMNRSDLSKNGLPMHTNNEEQILYQHFVDCRLKEQRQEVRRQDFDETRPTTSHRVQHGDNNLTEWTQK